MPQGGNRASIMRKSLAATTGKVDNPEHNLQQNLTMYAIITKTFNWREFLSHL